MKTKVTKLLMLLISVISMGAFVSCKDTNEDLYNELRTELLNEINKNTTLDEALKIRIEHVENYLIGLEKWKVEIEKWKEGIKSCNCTDVNSCDCDQEKINTLLTDFYSYIETHKLTDEEINHEINKLYGEIQKIQNDYVTKTYLQNLLNGLQEQIDILRTQLEEACKCKDVATLADLETAITAVRSELSGRINGLNDKLEGLNGRLEDLEQYKKLLASIDDRINTASEYAQQALKDAAAAKATADADSIRIDALEQNLKDNYVTNEALKNALEKLEEELGEELGKTNYTLDSLKNEHNTLKYDVEELKKKLNDCQKTCNENLQAAKDSIRQEMKLLEEKLQGQIDKNTYTIGIIQTEIIPDIQRNVNELVGRIEKAENTLADLTPMVKRLTGDVKAIQEYLSKQVTSIIIQGTHNPLFGSLSIPGTDIMSTSLVAFYGLPASDVEFPTSDDANYVRKSEVLTDKDMEMLGGLKVFEAPANLPLLNEGSNAGKVYVTINPSSADLTGLKLSIVNTLDEESPIKLSPIKKCEEKLQSGWTRANNGFYVAEASVTPRAVMTENGGLNFDKETIKELYKDTKEQLSDLAKDFNTGKINLSELATDVYSVMREVKVDKSGLKCTYTTTDADGVKKEHSVYSQYNLAATFLNPLNLGMGKDFNYETLPGYERAENLLNRISDAVKDRIDVIFNKVINVEGAQDFITHFQIDELTYIGEASELISNFEARVSHIVLNGTGYQLLVPGAGAFDVMFNKNLTANGAAVSIPAEVAYDEQNVTLSRAAVVIGGDIISGMNATLVIPAKGTEDDKVAAYASFVLSKKSATITASGNQITMTTEDGEYTIANVNGTSINTNECTDRVILTNVAGNGGSLRLPIAVEISNDLRDLLERQGGTINDIVNELNDMLNKINNYHGTINGWVDKGFEDYLKKYLDRVNTAVVNFINHINYKFGPFMVASNNNKGFKYLSNSKNYPTVLSADGLAIYPTTKNMELIVPLARKHVAVTNVFKGNESAQNGNADCKARLQAINGAEKLNTVIDGTVRKIDVSNMVSGYTYEIAYSVLDFEGNISTQKYYVTIK